MIEEALRTLVIADGDVADLLGVGFYFSEAPASASAPYGVFFKVSPGRVKSLGGPSGLARSRFQVECYGDDPESARDLATAIRRAVDGYRGTVTIPDTDPAETVRIGGIDVEGDRDRSDDPAGPGRRFRRILDLLVWHDET